MSDPKKYEYVSDGYTARFLNPQTGHAAPKGEYVRYEDYSKLRMERIHDLNQMGGQCEEIALLKAENARLKAALGKEVLAVIRNTFDEIARLKAQVELLTKAGDEMARLIQAIYEGEFSGLCEYEELKSWEAAKDGKPKL